MTRKLTLDTLGDLQRGAVRAVADAAIADILRDCDDRPNLEAPRKVTIELVFSPVHDDGMRGLLGVSTDVRIKKTVPPQRTRPEILKVDTTETNGGALEFEAVLPDRQDDLFDTAGAR